MLYWEPLETDELSEAMSGGVSVPELADVTVLDRERFARLGREKTRQFSTKETYR